MSASVPGGFMGTWFYWQNKYWLDYLYGYPYPYYTTTDFITYTGTGNFPSTPATGVNTESVILNNSILRPYFSSVASNSRYWISSDSYSWSSGTPSYTPPAAGVQYSCSNMTVFNNVGIKLLLGQDSRIYAAHTSNGVSYSVALTSITYTGFGYRTFAFGSAFLAYEIKANGLIYISSDGISYTSTGKTVPPPAKLGDITQVGSFLYYTDRRQTYKSSDGVNWSLVTASGSAPSSTITSAFPLSQNVVAIESTNAWCLNLSNSVSVPL